MGGCSPKMAGCSMQCGHKQMVMGYREEYQRQYDALVEESGGYSTEIADNMRRRREAGNPLPQFKDWLRGNKREQPMDDKPLTMNQLDNKALSEGVPLEGPRFLEAWANREGQEFLTDRQYVHPSVANEALLLSTGFSADRGVEALRVIQAREFRSEFHVNVRQAILDQADQGLPHDAAAVTEVLRSRSLSTVEKLPEPVEEGPFGPGLMNDAPPGVPWVQAPPRGAPWVPPPAPENTQLPIEFDPTKQGRPVEPRLFGLGAWETYSPPAAMAPVFAQTIRSDFRSHEMAAICERGAAAARSAIEYDETGLMSRDLVGTVRMDMANELRGFPPMLDENLRPTTGHSPSNIDPELLTVAASQTMVPVIEQNLRLPPAPVLSAASREVLSRD